MSDDDRAAQIAAIAERMDAIPLGGPTKGRRYAIHPEQRDLIAEEWYDKGLRVHPELQTKFPIPGPRRRGVMPYADLPEWVDAEAYREYLAKNPGAAAVAARGDKPSIAQLEAAMGAFDPELAARLKGMSPQERETARSEFAAKVPAALQRLAELADRNHRIKDAALRNDPTGGAGQ